MTINIVLCDIPYAKAGTAENDDGSYTICINKGLSQEQAKDEILHELSHINRNDFDAKKEATLIEEMIRRSDFIEDAKDMDFSIMLFKP